MSTQPPGATHAELSRAVWRLARESAEQRVVLERIDRHLAALTEASHRQAREAAVAQERIEAHTARITAVEGAAAQASAFRSRLGGAWLALTTAAALLGAVITALVARAWR